MGRPAGWMTTRTGGPADASAGIQGGYPRAYLVHDQSGAPHVAYRMTLGIIFHDAR